MKNLKRRKFLAAALGGAGAAAVWPFIPHLEAAEGDPGARFFYWYEPTMPKKQLAAELHQVAEGPLQFRGSWEALNAFSSKLLNLKDVDNIAGDDAEADVHERHGGSILTGERLIYNRQPIVYDFNGRSGYGPGVDSIDQWLSARFKEDCPIGDLRAGFRNTGNRDAIDRTISFKDGLPVFRHQKPIDLFKEVFGNATSNTTDVAELEARLRRKQSVLDSIRESVHRVEGRASRFDQIKIEHHLDSIRELEKGLTTELPQGELCTIPGSPLDPGEDANVAVPLYNEIITRAFACGITRVAGFFLGTNTQSYNYGFLPGAGSGFHGRTHDDGNDAFVRAVLAWRAKMWVDLMSRMDAVLEPNGKTLLDNSLIYFTSDLPWDHTSSDHLIVLAGGAGRFKMGQMKKLSGSTTNDVLTSIVHTMGFEVPHFGNADWGNGPLPSSVFT